MGPKLQVDFSREPASNDAAFSTPGISETIWTNSPVKQPHPALFHPQTLPQHARGLEQLLQAVKAIMVRYPQLPLRFSGIYDKTLDEFDHPLVDADGRSRHVGRLIVIFAAKATCTIKKTMVAVALRDRNILDADMVNGICCPKEINLNRWIEKLFGVSFGCLNGVATMSSLSTNLYLLTQSFREWAKRQGSVLFLTIIS